MSRDPREGYQQSQLLEDDDNQSVRATAGGSFIQSMLSAVVPRPLVKARIKGLNKLPSDIIRFKFCSLLDEAGHLKAGYLTDSDILTLSRVSKKTQGLFKSNWLQILADKLLLRVMQGNQAKAEYILKCHPALLLIKGTATDYSGRTFHCTAFQYALWALDTRYMCPMMLDCLPNSPEGERIKQGLLRQFLELESKGIKYQLVDNITMQEKHYDFTPLLTALKIYVDNFARWNWNMQRNQWCGVIAFAQHYLPAHVAQHYCDPDESFHPTPNFKKPKFTRVLQCYNYLTAVKSNWFSLGVTSGISRGVNQQPDVSGDNGNVAFDLAALTTLCQVRTKDLKLLKERLQEPPKLSCVIC